MQGGNVVSFTYIFEHLSAVHRGDPRGELKPSAGLRRHPRLDGITHREISPAVIRGDHRGQLASKVRGAPRRTPRK